jgi:hypothetical protein
MGGSQREYHGLLLFGNDLMMDGCHPQNRHASDAINRLQYRLLTFGRVRFAVNPKCRARLGHSVPDIVGGVG